MKELRRSVVVRSVDLEERTITGLAVPYEEVIDVPSEGIKEKFVRGAFEGSTDVKLYNEHKQIIGLVTKGEDTDEGYMVEAKISRTALGNDVYELMKDGALNSFSVNGWVLEDHVDDQGVTVRTKVQLNEVSVVERPAYPGAKVLAVRNEESISEVSAEENSNEKEDIDMSEEIKEVLSRVANLEAANEEVERRLSVRDDEAVKEEAPKKGIYRSGGDYLLALDKGESDAVAISRAFADTNGVLADFHTHEEWKNDLLKVAEKRRNVVNLFSKGTLPAQGMTVDAVVFDTVTGTVNSQVLEGDTLGTIKVDTTTQSFPVKVYGATSTLSRLALDRADVDSLNLTLEAQVQEYAYKTNAVVRSVLTAATYADGPDVTLSSAVGIDWLGATFDARDMIEENGRISKEADFILVSKDVWLAIFKLDDTAGRPVFDVNGDGSNTFGNVRGLVGSLGGLPVFYDRGLSAKTMYVASSKALTTWESPGVPFRVDAENPENLTKTYGIYGYMAAGVRDTGAIVKVDVA